MSHLPLAIHSKKVAFMTWQKMLMIMMFTAEEQEKAGAAAAGEQATGLCRFRVLPVSVG